MSATRKRRGDNTRNRSARCRTEAVSLLLLLAGCLSASAQFAPVSRAVVWEKGEFFFRLDGRQTFLIGRNPTGTTAEMFRAYFAQMANAGERLARIHLTTGFPQKTNAGGVDETWAAQWDSVFDAAAAKSISVLPVFDVWADWNDGSRGEPWHRWDKNPYNTANGGPARRPAGLFENAECQRLWLKWFDQLVRRWQARPNIVGWEIFSELDLITGATEEIAIPFVRAATMAVRTAGAPRRPVTASLSGVREWPRLFRSDALDIIQVHPYGKNLDEMILKTVRQRLGDYGKPVIIGECGLDAAGPGGIASAPRAEMGIRHAIWAALVSGAMNGRMLWWEDGYDFYSGCNLRERYQTIAQPAAAFVRGIDFAGFQPIQTVAANGLTGGAIGNTRVIVGWFRDALCRPPDWPVRPIKDATVTLKLPAGSRPTDVQFCDPTTGRKAASRVVAPAGRQLQITSPDFEDAVAFVVHGEPAAR